MGSTPVELLKSVILRPTLSTGPSVNRIPFQAVKCACVSESGGKAD